MLCEEIQSISSFGEAIKLPDATSALEMVQKAKQLSPQPYYLAVIHVCEAQHQVH